MVAVVSAVALHGIVPRPVRVECVCTAELPGFRVVGLPDTAVRQAAERVQSAVRRSELDWPQRKFVVNLAPAALPKSGAGFDLAIALAAVAATGQVRPEALRDVYACGELGLDGEVRPVPGVLPVARAARDDDARRLLVAERAAPEAALVGDLDVVPVADLAEAVAVLRGDAHARPVPAPAPATEEPVPDLEAVRGQTVGRRALEIAAAGGHHVLLAGPPGCGKSMLARRLPGLLPPLDVDAALEVAAIHSVAGLRDPEEPLSRRPGFRAPHHTTSVAGLVGGGSGVPRPGELSLAHRGVLFLDELLETPRWVLDALREPLERGEVAVVRARGAVRYPARVLLVAAANPCPCGHLGASRRPCRCRPDQIERYRARLSGPLLDRLDLQVELRPVGPDHLEGPPDGEPTATVAARVLGARRAAGERWGDGALVRDASPAQVRETATPAALRQLARAVDALALSARSFDRCLRVARTVADLAGRDAIGPDEVDEAVAYRLPPVSTS